MPNHVRSYLSIHGPAPAVARFIQAARGRMPHSGDTEGHSCTRGKEMPEQIFCFHSLVPLPKRFSEVPYSTDGKHDGFALECLTWGVKWGAYCQNSPVVDPGLATYAFTTAWQAPTKLLAKLAPKWPALLFFLSWGGEGPTRGTALYENASATVRDEPYCKEDYPADDSFPDDSDAYFKAYCGAEKARLTEHPRKLLAAIARRRFALQLPEPQNGIDPLADWAFEQGYERHVGLLIETGPLEKRK